MLCFACQAPNSAGDLIGKARGRLRNLCQLSSSERRGKDAKITRSQLYQSRVLRTGVCPPIGVSVRTLPFSAVSLMDLHPMTSFQQFTVKGRQIVNNGPSAFKLWKFDEDL
ncbi:Apoptosis-Inducing Factor 3 [Manis pentadactyla]|nr:Apoptosis-Inducing Factor 3 [Manis pentadactyla]